MRDFSEMGMDLGPFSRAYWTVCWRFLTPSVLAALLLMSWANSGTLAYGEYVYPWGAQVMEGKEAFLFSD